MAFRYTVKVNDPSQRSGDAALSADVSAAAAQWSRYIHGSGSIEVEVVVAPTPSSGPELASGGPASTVYSGMEGAFQVRTASTAHELNGGTDVTGEAADLVINVGPDFADRLWLDPGAPPPAGKYDGLTVFMHEIAHGLGIISYRDAATGTLTTYETTWDKLIAVRADGGLVFIGTYARAIYGGNVPVTTLRNSEQYSHLGNSVLEATSRDLMSGLGLTTATRLAISDLDLAIMKDLGLAVISGTNGDPLLDPFWYTTRYADVSAARIGTVSHYENFGWHEGRDPSAFFSTSGYLAANPDVLAAGLNPLRHFEAFGWREGRDASAAFDDEVYLARNPDVRAAGIAPLQHYLTDGRFEGRQAYAAIGTPASFTHGSFDAEYYLLANADVARAALATGGNSLAFAYQHYETHGWREGRNPNSVFDVQGYLAAYADVRAANLDPLLHYDLYGWREGRDPAAGFDTRGYISHYADVAAAHLDPLQHYLQFGAVEGRSTFGDGQIA